MQIELKLMTKNLEAQVRRSEIIANNLANANSPGFKRDTLFIELLDTQQGATAKIETQTDFSHGNIRQTDNPFDLALSKQGFFVIEKDGEELYTRNGRFMLDEEGFLSTSTGEKLLGQQGWINLLIEGQQVGKVTINQLGEIFVDEQLVDQLRVVDFDNYQMLSKASGNAFRTDPANPPLPAEEAVVLQGRIEESNVSVIDEMIGLIGVERQFESGQKLIKTLDHNLEKVVNVVGRFR
jgi:flagellar basal body rod protein FlgG